MALISDIFALPCPRAMFLLLAALASKFHLLSYGQAPILVFIGAEKVPIRRDKIAVLVSLGVVVGVLAVTMGWASGPQRAARKKGSCPRRDLSARCVLSGDVMPGRDKCPSLL
jgi:predicted tellurium resistance membrane protein TerC